MAAWGLGFFEAPSSRTKTSSTATGCAAVMGRSVGNVPAALTLLPSSVYCIPSQGKGPRNWVPETRASFRKHGRRAGGKEGPRGLVIAGARTPKSTKMWPARVN